jgi:peptidoglycan/xylan/chitin deacetylase (PgdA/CDA1 family)
LLDVVQIREMHRYGVQFGSHSLSHPFLTELSDRELRREVFDSKSRLEEMLGHDVSCFAYPYGDLDARVRAAVADAGYRFAFTVNAGGNLWDDRLALNRIGLAEEDSILSLWMKLRTGRSFSEEVLSILLRRIPRQARPTIRGIWQRRKRNRRAKQL